jgi:hypothetical protein
VLLWWLSLVGEKTAKIWRGVWFAWPLLFLVVPIARAQDAVTSDPSAQSATEPPPSVSEKWNFFVSETLSPLTVTAASIDSVVSQLTRSAPLYGRHFWHHHAFPKRFLATVGDYSSENFFSDFLLASAFHEDTRYHRMGPVHGVWRRMGYAISRAVVTRTDSGAGTFNWANVLGCGMSAALSNAYYPPVSRTPSVALVNWGTNIAGAGLTNIAPEFGSDVAHWFKRHLPAGH